MDEPAWPWPAKHAAVVLRRPGARVKIAHRSTVLATWPARQPATHSMAFQFFLSYARLDARGRDGKRMEELYEDLCEEVRKYIGVGEAREMGFRDVDMGEGQLWSEKIRDALQEANVLVALVSPTYVRRPYCGKEWYVFEERRKLYCQAQGKKDSPPVIVPLWLLQQPIPAMPPCVGRITFDSSFLPAAYSKQGLLYVLRRKDTPKGKTAYFDLIERLGQRIYEIARDHALPALPTLQSYKDAPNAFEEATGGQPAVAPARPGSTVRGGPSEARFIYVAARPEELDPVLSDTSSYVPAGGEDWKPFSDEIVDFCVNRGAMKANFKHNRRPNAHQNLIAELSDALDNNAVAIVVVDPCTAILPSYREALKSYQLHNFPNCAFIIVWGQSISALRGPRKEVEDALQSTFFLQYNGLGHKKLFKDGIADAEALESEVADTLSFLKALLISYARASRPMRPQGAQELPIVSAKGTV